MPNTIVISVPPYEGEYELDLTSGTFTQLEWRWITKLTNYGPLTWQEGWAKGDTDLMLVVAIIAMYRAGKIAKGDFNAVVDAFDDAPVDGAAIEYRLEGDDEEGEADPPKSDSPDDSSSDSGPSTGEPTGHSQVITLPSGTGIQVSATGMDSGQATSAT